MAAVNSLFDSAYKGECQLVQLKVDDNKQLIHEVDTNKRLLIHWAALGGHDTLVKYLLECGSPVDPLDDVDMTPLVLAASAGRENVTRTLISHGAKVNHKNYQGHSALQYACSKGWKEITTILLNNHADVNIVDIRGASPLHRAASKGNIEIVKLLLSNDNLKIDLQDFYGNTALHLACEEDRQEEAKLLAQHGAQLDITNHDRMTPLDLCTIPLARVLKASVKK